MIVCPIEGVVICTQPFGVNPSTYLQFGLIGHNGIDFTGENKKEMKIIHAPIEGVVAEVGNQGNRGYGKYVRMQTIQEDEKKRRKQVVLAHLSEIYVKKGDFVYLLDPIGKEGNTGFSTGPHLHLGLRFIDNKNAVIDAGNGFKGYKDFLSYLVLWNKREGKTGMIFS